MREAGNPTYSLTSGETLYWDWSLHWLWETIGYGVFESVTPAVSHDPTVWGYLHGNDG
jgi:hypothetical protein